ncbi:MAG: HEAT repeat domain-containing protein [Bacteroidota bacterium]
MRLLDFMKPNIKKLKKRQDMNGLIKAAMHTDADIRVGAVSSLSEFKDPQVLATLKNALKDQSHLVRKQAVIALQSIGGKIVVEPLIEALDDSIEDIRLSSAKALVQIGEPAVEPLISALVKPDGWVCIEAALALAAIGDSRAGNPLKKALENGTFTLVERVKLEGALVEWAAAPMRNLPPNLKF